MKQRLSNKHKWLKNIHLTADDDLYIGIDAHKKSFHVALWLNDAPAVDFVTTAQTTKLIETLDKLRPAIKRIVYEAGPTGYPLARALQKAHLPVNVVAPSKTPRKPAPDSKTDSLDARKLAEYAAKGLLRNITIPTKQQEAQRQLTRLREQLVRKQSRIKLQIKSFLLQHGIQQPPALRYWSAAAVDQLRNIRLSAHLRYCLDVLLEEFIFIGAQLKDVKGKIKGAFAKTPLAKKVEILATHPGVGQVVATQFATELFKPKRFKHKTELAKYLGLAPSVHQSGQSLRNGPITKTGRPQLRSNLIQAAWIWITCDPYARKAFNRLVHNTGHPNKAITAIARKLAIHLWKMACLNEPYDPVIDKSA